MDEIKYILNKIESSNVGKEPFYHLYIEDIFPDDFYNKLKSKCTNPDKIESREQDNKTFVNSRFNFTKYIDYDPILSKLNKIFDNKEIKKSILSKFYLNPNFFSELQIHKDEFEFVYTGKNKFQNIHTDIPSKFLSFVFYFPNDDDTLSEEEQYNNGTIMYDKNMIPFKNAKYKSNSVCIFAQSFHSYHGFHTTIERTALVMFYINKELHEKYEKTIGMVYQSKENRIKAFKNNILHKLTNYPLLEYKNFSLSDAFENCKINEEKGRIII